MRWVRWVRRRQAFRDAGNPRDGTASHKDVGRNRRRTNASYPVTKGWAKSDDGPGCGLIFGQYRAEKLCSCGEFNGVVGEFGDNTQMPTQGGDIGLKGAELRVSDFAILQLGDPCL